MYVYSLEIKKKISATYLLSRKLYVFFHSILILILLMFNINADHNLLLHRSQALFSSVGRPKQPTMTFIIQS